MSKKPSNPAQPFRPRTTPLSRLTAALRETLVSKCQPGDMMPSERSLAEMFHTSRITIHKALDQLCQEGWLQRIAGQGYLVKRLRRQPHQTTGFFFPADPFALLVTPFYQEVYLGICRAAATNNRHILSIFDTRWHPEDMRSEEFWSPGLRSLDSLLTLEVFNKELIGQAAGFYPVVCLDMPCQLPGVSSIYFDHAASIQMAYKYLLDLGHRRIGYVGKPRVKDPADLERNDAYQRVVRWTGESVSDDLVFHATHEPTDDLVARWLNTPPERRPSALIVTTYFWDLVARLHQAGVRVPRDVSVVHVGTLATWSDYARSIMLRLSAQKAMDVLPALQPPYSNQPADLALLIPTTVSMPSAEIGREGLLELVRRKADPAAEPRHLMLEPTLVQGHTTKPYP